MNYILYSSSLGQLKNGVKKTPKIIKNYIFSKKIYNTRCSNNIYRSLKNLYKINKCVKEKIKYWRRSFNVYCNSCIFFE